MILQHAQNLFSNASDLCSRWHFDHLKSSLDHRPRSFVTPALLPCRRSPPPALWNPEKPAPESPGTVSAGDQKSNFQAGPLRSNTASRFCRASASCVASCWASSSRTPLIAAVLLVVRYSRAQTDTETNGWHGEGTRGICDL